MGNRGFYGFSFNKNTYPPSKEYFAYPVDYANLLMWLSADKIVGLNQSDPVGSWPDNVGLATVAQTTAANKPTYKINYLNNYPAVEFAYGNYMTISGLTIGATVTYIAVTRNLSQSNLSSVHKPVLAAVADPYLAGATGWGFGYRRLGSDGFTVQQSSAYAITVSSIPTELFEVVSFVKTGSQADLYRNGVKVGTNAAFSGTGGDAGGYWLGGQASDASRRYTGAIAEVLIYSTALDSSSRQHMENALMGKYNIQ